MLIALSLLEATAPVVSAANAQIAPVANQVDTSAIVDSQNPGYYFYNGWYMTRTSCMSWGWHLKYDNQEIIDYFCEPNQNARWTLYVKYSGGRN